MHRGEIYLVDLSNQVGSEQTGIRPALIVQNEQGNQHSPHHYHLPSHFARQDTDRNPRYADAKGRRHT